MLGTIALATTIAATSLVFASPAQAAPTGFVHRVGRTLVDGQGNPLRLKGVNLGQWLFWEMWLMGGGNMLGNVGETGLFNNLASVVGTPAATQFQTDLRNNYVTLADFQQIHAMGFNHVRIPFNHTLLEDDAKPGVYKQSGWDLLDRTLASAEQTNTYVILDLHSAPCGQSSLFTADPGPTLLWNSTSCQDRTVALWKAIAARYANRTIIAGYDLLNEPSKPSNPALLVTIYQRIIAAVRSVDPNHVVFTEGSDAATDFSMFTGPLDANQAYSMHHYPWGSDPSAAAISVSKRDNLPLWLGEFGQDSPAKVAAQVDHYDPSPDVVGWTDWTWKGVDTGGAPQVRKITATPNWLKTIGYMNDTWFHARPSVAEATAGMADLIRNMQFANTTQDQMLADALRTTPAPAPLTGSGTGLTGAYSNGTTFTPVKLTRVDPTINFDWGSGSPAAGINADNFSVRWTGSIQAPRSETYLFTATSDDGVRVWINGQLVVDDYSGHSARDAAGLFTMTAGTKYSIQVDHYELGGNAVAKLSWESARTAKAIVPTSQLYPT